jgi:hypothetical protein
MAWEDREWPCVSRARGGLNVPAVRRQEEEVLGFDVAMHHAACVHEGEHGEQLVHHVHRTNDLNERAQWQRSEVRLAMVPGASRASRCSL